MGKKNLVFIQNHPHNNQDVALTTELAFNFYTLVG